MKWLISVLALSFVATCYGEETTTLTKTKEEIHAEKILRDQTAKRQKFHEQRERRRATERAYEACLAQCRTSCKGS